MTYTLYSPILASYERGNDRVFITLSHKIRLQPTATQEVYLRRACGVARFTWNWALAEWKRRYELGEKPTALGLKKEFNAIKPVEFQ